MTQVVMAEKEYGFDYVFLLMPGGGYNLITKKEFLAKPLDERIRLVASNRLEFVKDGQVIPLKKAFKL